MFRFCKKYYKKTGKSILPVFFIFALLVIQRTHAQKHEFGLGVGGFNYTGDVNPRYDFLNYRPAGMVFYRYNPTRVVAIRLGVTIGAIGGTEKKSKEPTAGLRQAKFNGSISEISLMGEYNFINFRDKKQLLKFSPYLTGGFALFGSGPTSSSNSISESNESEGINLAIPFGLGIKFILTKNWNLGTEFVARKTFTDYLDGISNGQMGTKVTGNTVDNDWYYYTGISVSYTIYGVNCPQEYKY